MSKEALSVEDTLKLALEALENSVDLVVEDAYNAGQLYGKYPTRQGKVNGLKVLAEQHKQAITAIKEALSSPNGEAQPEQHQDWCASLTRLLMSMPPKPAPCNCKPPQRTAAVGEDTKAWVGLTDREKSNLWLESRAAIPRFYTYASLVEAKLKEKNTNA